MPAKLPPPRFGKGQTVIVDIETEVLSKIKCIVDDNLIPFVRAWGALRKHQEPKFCSDRCMHTQQMRGYRETQPKPRPVRRRKAAA